MQCYCPAACGLCEPHERQTINKSNFVYAETDGCVEGEVTESETEVMRYRHCEAVMDVEEGEAPEWSTFTCLSPGVLYEATYSDAECTQVVEEETYRHAECTNVEGTWERSTWDGSCQPEVPVGFGLSYEVYGDDSTCTGDVVEADVDFHLYKDCEASEDDENEWSTTECVSPGVIREATYTDAACTQIMEEEYYRYGECVQVEGIWEVSIWDGACQPEPSYECGETMEECNMAYQTSQADLDAALSVTCNPTPAPTAAPSLWQSTMSMYTTADLTDPLSNWMFNQMNNNAQIQEDFGLNDGNTLAVIGNQYVVVSGDYVYPTCVQHGAAGDAADPTLVTLTGTTAGQASEQRSALYLAADRNDFKHEDCPDLEGVCTKLSGFFMDMLADRGRVPETIAENLCVDSMGSLMYVTQDAYKHICVGHGGSADSIELCPMSNTDIYFCGGINGGLGTWGYPGQQMGAVEQAYSYATNDGNGPFDAYMFMHPQCRNY